MTKIRKKRSSGDMYGNLGGGFPLGKGGKKSAPLVEVTGSSRGPGANELTSIALNNEIPFCRVFSLKQKETVERLLMNNGISYFVKWKEQSFLSRLIKGERENVVFVIFIHDTMVEKARDLVRGVKGIKLLVKGRRR